MKFQWPRTPDEVKDFKDERYLYVPFGLYVHNSHEHREYKEVLLWGKLLICSR